MGPTKTRSNLAVALVVVLLCSLLIGMGMLMGSNDVFALEPEASPEVKSDATPPVSTPAPSEPPAPADEALQLTEQDERVATRQALRSLQPVTRTVAVGMDVEAAAQTMQCTFVPVYVDGVFGGYSYVVNGKAYLALSDYCTMLGYEFADGEVDGTNITCTAAEMPVEATVGASSFMANGRYINAPGNILALDGKLVVPFPALEDIFGAKLNYDQALASVAVDTSTKELIEDGESFYAKQDLYWLSRIIYAEANGQPFDGMIGVGNVVLNRVAAPQFANTIYDVIFEAGQFTPVYDGSIYNTPSEEAIRAAEMALDGVSTVGSALYFVNPNACDGSWFAYSLTYVTTIGGHVFYA